MSPEISSCKGIEADRFEVNVSVFIAGVDPVPTLDSVVFVFENIERTGKPGQRIEPSTKYDLFRITRVIESTLEFVEVPLYLSSCRLNPRLPGC